ncbi:MAG TPA: hypothetical protein VJJ47_01795 [Candidatus Paceibacterota bacterium]
MSSSQSVTYYGCTYVIDSFLNRLPVSGRNTHSPHVVVFRVTSSMPLAKDDEFLAAPGLRPFRVLRVLPFPAGTLPGGVAAVVRFYDVPLDGVDVALSMICASGAVQWPRPGFWRLVGQALFGLQPLQPNPAMLKAVAEREAIRISAEVDTFLRELQPEWLHASPLAPLADAIIATLFRPAPGHSWAECDKVTAEP